MLATDIQRTAESIPSAQSAFDESSEGYKTNLVPAERVVKAGAPAPLIPQLIQLEVPFESVIRPADTVSEVRVPSVCKLDAVTPEASVLPLKFAAGVEFENPAVKLDPVPVRFVPAPENELADIAPLIAIAPVASSVATFVVPPYHLKVWPDELVGAENQSSFVPRPIAQSTALPLNVALNKSFVPAERVVNVGAAAPCKSQLIQFEVVFVRSNTPPETVRDERVPIVVIVGEPV